MGEKRKRRLARRPALLPLVFLCLVLAAPADAAFRGARGKIAFARDQGGNVDVYTIEQDGTGLTRLTTEPAQDLDPTWSPDGTKIAFVSNRSGVNAIYTMNADGSGASLVATDSPVPQSPAWAPDGQRIVYVRPIQSSFSRELVVVNADGSNKQVIFTGNAASSPAWSPDGTKIAFTGSITFPGTHIYTINADGTGITKLTGNGGFPDSAGRSNFTPDWSPNGSKITFTKQSDVTPDEITCCPKLFEMNADGSGQILLTNPPYLQTDNAPVYSPDGSRIAFVRVPSQSGIWGALHTIDVARHLPDAPLLDGLNAQPSWQPLPMYDVPAAAPSVRVSIVPAFIPCGTPANPTNGRHAPPLDVESCNPPQSGSHVARVGPQSTGSAELAVLSDPSDVRLTADLTDVTTTTGSDYNPNPGDYDLTMIERFRITDHANGSGGRPGTASEIDFRAPVDCRFTTGPEGAGCTASTSANALLPGSIQPGENMVIQVFRVRVDDAGDNGVRGDSDDRIFATQGVYIP